MRTRSREGFTTITTEGSILPPDLLARIVERDKDLDGLDPSSYNLAGETLNEAISRSWNVLQGVWAAFRDRRGALPEGQPETGMTRERWLLPLFRELGYGQLLSARAVEIEGKSYPISHAWQHAPIHLVGFRTGLDKRTPGVAGAARVSPHGLVQEFLNRSDDRLWGFLSDGLRLRILRDNASLTRQAYVEFDLEAMMDGEVYPDFVLLWLLCHQSRVEAERPEECYLEKWSHDASEQGTRALEGLRQGVEEAIASLGSGFLSHHANNELRGRLRSGELEAQDYYRQLLRLVYRLLFLFVAEDRNLLLDPDADDAARDRYSRFYSTRKLRSVAEKRVGARHSDLYTMQSLVMDRLGDERGCPELGLPALGSLLFSREAMPDLTGAEVSNRNLLDAVRALSFTVVDGAYRAVDYKNLGAEELGSVYESLLELQPELDSTSGSFTLRAVTGNERKTTGSYYTPHSLVTSLLDTALDPVLDEAARKPDPEKAILNLKVCDPAVGSGHFLIAAAHRMAKRLASVRTGDDEPSPEATREALRDVIGRCLYGVDVNPMAAELCRVSLWMEALVPGRPLSFLDHHIQVGNSLLGTTPDLISDGIPDGAFKPIQGDDKKLTSAYRKRNREERKAWESGQLAFSLRTFDKNREAIERGYEQIDKVSESSVAAVREKAARYAALQRSDEMFHARRLADAWCAAFVWPKREGEPDAITQEAFAHLTQDAHALSATTGKEIERIARRYNLFHWDLAFSDVLGETGPGGFDVVLGNPPWEHVKLQEQEWFAARRPEIATASSAAARKRMIRTLIEEDRALHITYLRDLRKAEGESHLIRNSARFPLCGKGDINTYSIFAETNRQIINPVGRVGCIVPSGIATDNTTRRFFNDLMSRRALVSLYDFENRRSIFPGVGHGRFKFCLLTMTGKNRAVEEAKFAFFALDVSDLADTERQFELDSASLEIISPTTKSLVAFRSRRDRDLAIAICDRMSYLSVASVSAGARDSNWNCTFTQGTFHSSNDSTIFDSEDTTSLKTHLRLFEPRMFHQFDHRFSSFLLGGQIHQVRHAEHSDPTYVATSRYWVAKDELLRRIDLTGDVPVIAYRRIARPTDERTMIATVIPTMCINENGVILRNDSLSTLQHACLLGNLCSFVLDYVLRQRDCFSLSNSDVQQLPVLPARNYARSLPWELKQNLENWVALRVLELTYTAWDLEPFALDLGYEGPPFRWDPERRFLLRCELDAAYFHLYGIERDDADYIMETFPIVKRKDEAAHGEYRTKRVILEIYDHMARATETGQPYQTLLDPPPVKLDLSSKESAPSTVTPLRQREEHSYLQPEESPPASMAAEEKASYGKGVKIDANNPTPEQLQDVVDTILEGADFSQLPPEHRGDSDTPTPDQSSDTLPEATLFPENEVETRNTIPSIKEAALALNACVPDGEKVQREKLLLDAARKLGHTKLTRQVRRALNKSLNAEHSAGRLRTDWERVWKPRKK